MMENGITDTFNSFQDYLLKEQETREEIRNCVREIDKYARDIAVILQNIHSNHEEENDIVSIYCAKARETFEEVRNKYQELIKIVPADQYYRFHDQWRMVTQKLVFAAALIVYLEVKILISRETAAEFLGIKSKREDGFYLDLEDFLMGLLQLSSELCRFAINSVTSGNYSRPLEIAHFVNQLNAGFRVLNLKNDSLRKRYDALKYDVKKIEEVVYDLTIRGIINKKNVSEPLPENSDSNKA